MQFISASLGVDCEHCHVEHAPEKDDRKEKQTARRMIAMTAAINRDTFEGKREVTCWSCHRGSIHPVVIPAVGPVEGGQEEAEGAAAEGKEAEKPAQPAPAAVLDKFLRAMGGPEALARVTTRTGKGTMTGFGPAPIAVELTMKAPDRRISVVHSPRGDSITAFDGRGGWLGGFGRPARDMSAAESEAARLDGVLGFPAGLQRFFKDFRNAPPETLDGRAVVRLEGINKDGAAPVELWFDAESGLLVRLVRYGMNPLGLNPTRIDYFDYKDADGVKIPFRWSVSRPGTRFEIRLDEVHQNQPVADSAFEKPAAPAGP
jgi:hypothetical protein